MRDRRRTAGAWTTVVLVGIATVGLPALGCHGDPEPSSDRTVTVDLSADIEALGSDDLFVSDPAVDRIVALGEPAAPVLARVFPSERPAVRVGIIEVLRKIGGQAATDALLAAAQDPEVEVRYEALLVLGDVDDERVSAPVEAALRDSEERVRLAAAAACASACKSEAALAQLVDMAIGDPAIAIGVAARASLIAIIEEADSPRGERAAASIRVQSASVMNGDSDLSHRTRAALLAADVGDPAAAPVLVTAVAELEDPRLRMRATYALGDVGGEESVAAVRERLDGGPFTPYAYDALRRMAARDVAGARDALDRYEGPRPDHPLPRP